MNELFVPYNEALELKQLGFDETCFGVYFNETKQFVQQLYNDTRQFYRRYFTVAPTFSQAFRWFREKYGLHYYITTHDETDYEWYVYNKEQNDWEDDITQETYEEAELACLRKLIQICKSTN